MEVRVQLQGPSSKSSLPFGSWTRGTRGTSSFSLRRRALSASLILLHSSPISLLSSSLLCCWEVRLHTELGHGYGGHLSRAYQRQARHPALLFRAEQVDRPLLLLQLPCGASSGDSWRFRHRNAGQEALAGGGYGAAQGLREAQERCGLSGFIFFMSFWVDYGFCRGFEVARIGSYSLLGVWLGLELFYGADCGFLEVCDQWRILYYIVAIRWTQPRAGSSQYRLIT